MGKSASQLLRIVKTVKHYPTTLISSKIVYIALELTVGVCPIRVGPLLLQASSLLPLPHIQEEADHVPQLFPSRLLNIFRSLAPLGRRALLIGNTCKK